MENTQGNDFYDKPEVFERYIQHRQRINSPNEIIEKPIIKELVHGIHGHVLDLGCGYGDLASFLIQEGAEYYTGLDASEKMITFGKSRIKDHRIKLIQKDIEKWNYRSQKYDFIISRLVFHYIKDLERLFIRIQKSLKPEGTFLFSVEHPVLTSSMSLPKLNEKKKGWIVDQYFDLGERKQDWMGDQVIKYHRTLERYWEMLQESGFKVETIREGCPQREFFQSDEEYERRKRIPVFLIIKGRKR